MVAGGSHTYIPPLTAPVSTGIHEGAEIDSVRRSERDVTMRKFIYRHPLYTREEVGAQKQWGEVSSVNRTHYCGAYWSYGFHEDGLSSAIRVARTLGVEW